MGTSYISTPTSSPKISLMATCSPPASATTIHRHPIDLVAQQPPSVHLTPSTLPPVLQSAPRRSSRSLILLPRACPPLTMMPVPSGRSLRLTTLEPAMCDDRRLLPPRVGAPRSLHTQLYSCVLRQSSIPPSQIPSITRFSFHPHCSSSSVSSTPHPCSPSHLPCSPLIALSI